MLNSSDFKTKTSIRPRQNPSIDGKWIVGVDVGYSGCKVFSQNKTACFPCYAKVTHGELINTSYDPNDIWYQDAKTKEIWAVGETAIKMMSSRDTNDNSVSMYSRSRYEDPMFLVVLRVGLGLGLLANTYGDSSEKEIFVETGLPAAYMTDTEALKDAFCQRHEFAIKIGNNPWEKIDLTLDADHVFVTSQPKGTLYSSIIGDNGEFTTDSVKILRSKTLIFDAGFNTLDLVRIMNNVIDTNNVSYDDLGMKQVFIETAKEVEKRYKEHIEIPYMQQILETGVLQAYDRKTHSSSEIQIGEIVNRKSEDVCSRAIKKIRGMYNELLDLDYMVVTGGTGEAWWSQIQEEFSGLKTLSVLPGNENSDLPFTFSNVRGYYFYLYRTLMRKNK